MNQHSHLEFAFFQIAIMGVSQKKSRPYSIVCSFLKLYSFVWHKQYITFLMNFQYILTQNCAKRRGRQTHFGLLFYSCHLENRCVVSIFQKGCGKLCLLQVVKGLSAKASAAQSNRGQTKSNFCLARCAALFLWIPSRK